MIVGIGIDIVEISRIEQYLTRFGQRGKDRLFLKREQTYCDSKINPNLHYAARFAAKEAFSKARRTGIGGDLSWLDVEVGKHENGAPYITLSEKIMKDNPDLSCHLSLSHSDQYAVAVVTLERNQAT